MTDDQHDGPSPQTDPTRSSDGAPASAEPIASAERLIGLDALRGVALFGILMMNIWLFSQPMQVLFLQIDVDALRAARAGAEGLGSFVTTEAFANAAVSAIRDTFFAAKFISLFSMMFGAGIALQAARFAERGRPFWPFLGLRLVTLACFGAMHGLLVWYGDVLLVYACAGVSMFLFVHLRPKTLVGAAVVLLFVATVLNTGLTSLQALAPPMPDAATIAAEGETDVWTLITQSQFNPAHPAWERAELLAYGEGPWSAQFTMRASSYAMAFLISIFGYGWHVMAMFAIGAALLKSGFFAPEGSALRRRVLAIALPAGLVVEASRTALAYTGHVTESALVLAGSISLMEIGTTSLALGYAALVVEWAQGATGFARAVAERVAAVGRMALTNYLLQSIIATTIFYSFGGGLFGEMPPWSLPLFVIAIWGAQLIWSKPLLAAFGRGPFEAVWRGVTYPLYRLLVR